ncbi:MAG: GGDEF and EAL domain-containing protein [Deltaproteobacteria bacterium]|nr:GGDEF and EAL domain-containing protein [Deltaproteobacteria bacterium]
MPGAASPLDQQQLLRVAGRWLHALTEGSREVVALLAQDGSVQFLSMGGVVADLIGHDAVDLAGMELGEIIHPDDLGRVRDSFDHLAGTPDERLTVEYRARHRDGQYVRVESTGVNLLHDKIVRAVVVHTRRAGPPSSGAPAGRLRDRASFLDVLREAVARAQNERGYGFSVLIVELDRYRLLVGSYGQELADAVLAEVARRVGAEARPQDTIALLGGGELAVLLDGVGEGRQAGAVADAIQRKLEERYHVEGREIATSAIVGIASSERRYARAEDVMRDAALATHRARGPGRRRRAVFQTQMRVEDSDALTMVAQLYGALQRDELQVFYQPIVALGTRTLVGFEALVRWFHPQRGVVLPAQFIPMAEETGLVVPLGALVLGEACRQMARWHAEHAGAAALHVSVNLSPKQLAEEDLRHQIEKALRVSSLPPACLKLEVTESAVLEKLETTTKVLHGLKELGVRLSLDDFGTGYSSFSYLHQLPYDTLKIDRSFVSRMGERGEGCEIVQAIVGLAHNLRMEVVAEGVEAPHQAAFLQSMRCEYAQGYLFAKPLPGPNAAALIGTRPRW